LYIYTVARLLSNSETPFTVYGWHTNLRPFTHSYNWLWMNIVGYRVRDCAYW